VDVREEEEVDLDDELGAGAGGSAPTRPEALSDEDRLLAIFSYLGPLCLVALVASRREFVLWHAKQGLLLGSLTLATFFVLRPFHRLFYHLLPFLGQTFTAMEILVGLGFFLTGALCVVKALEGRRFRIPFLADVVDRF
jgi:uncharacterized membrane protein